MSERMTKGERDDLVRLVKQRERVAKSAAAQRSAALLADFEQKISALHSFDKDEVWAQAVAFGKEAFDQANKQIKERSKALGIPADFAPQLYLSWAQRGQNESKNRREEMRRAAKAEIEALEQTARVRIESDSVTAQTEIIANGLSSEAARTFLEKLPAVETLMPILDLQKVEDKLAAKAGRPALRLISTDDGGDAA